MDYNRGHRRFLSRDDPKEFEAAVFALDEVVKNRAVRGNYVHYAYAAATCDIFEKDWAKAKGLKRSSAVPCIRKLLGLRCSHYAREPHASSPPCRPPMSDHVSMWNKDGKPYVYVSQPYPSASKDLVELITFCSKWELEVDIGTWPAWHYPGSVLMVEIRRAKPGLLASRPIGPS